MGFEDETVHFQVPVQMMNTEEMVETYRDQMVNTSVLHLPFNSSHSMLLLLPDNMAVLEDAISPGHVAKWLKWMKSRFGKSTVNWGVLMLGSATLCLCMSSHLFLRKYDVYVPKFSIKTSYALKDVLSEMGIADMFGMRADLSGISEGLMVSQVRVTDVSSTFSVTL